LLAEATALLPPGFPIASTAIAAALAEQGDLRQAREEAAEMRDAIRASIEEIKASMAGGENELAGLRGMLQQLDEEKSRLGCAAAESVSRLLAIAKEYCWEEIGKELEAGRAPSKMIATAYKDACDEADELTGRIRDLETEAALIRDAIDRAEALRAEETELRKTAELYHEAGRLLRADQFQAFVIEEALEALAESATEHLK